MKDYSQEGEQAVILEHAPLEPGRFCDVGAYDAFTFSNTRALFELGWGGVVVEPHPAHAARLRAAYPAGGRVSVLEAAVGPIPGMGLLQMTDDATSTLHPATFAKWQDDVEYSGSTTVQVISWDAVYALGPFDVVNIDAEGWSVPLLLELLHHGHRPAVLIVEYDDLLALARFEAQQAGYSVAMLNGTNLVLVLR